MIRVPLNNPINFKDSLYTEVFCSANSPLGRAYLLGLSIQPAQTFKAILPDSSKTPVEVYCEGRQFLGKVQWPAPSKK